MKMIKDDVRLEEFIDELDFRYTTKIEGYANLISDIPKLSAIGCLENGKRYYWQNILKWDDDKND